MATIQEIEKLLDKKLVIHREQIMKELDDKWRTLVETNQKNIAANTTSIEGLEGEIEKLKTSCDRQISDLEQQLSQCVNELDEQVNRSMRGNVIIKGIPEVESEGEKENWDATKSIVTEHIASLSNENPDAVFRKLDRVHRGGKKDNDKPRHIYANFIYSTDASYYVDLSVKQWVNSHNKSEPQPTWRIEQQFSKKLTARRDQALLYRQKLLKKKEYAKCRVAYPAKLLGKKDKNSKRWDFIKDF